jgi:pimeloyl-ACP methyl ester carboxylesterase
MANRQAASECVFAVHGFLGSSFEFIPLKARLQSAGYDVKLWGHGSVLRSTEEYAGLLAEAVQREMRTGDYSKIHFLGHSMGGVIVRGALQKMEGGVRAERRGRVVLLATPNQGSPVASFFTSSLGAIIPAVVDLSEAESSYANSLQGDYGWETGTVWTPYDHLVPEKSAKMNGSKDAARVDGLHSSILFKKELADKILCFLSNGSFS